MDAFLFVANQSSCPLGSSHPGMEAWNGLGMGMEPGLHLSGSRDLAEQKKLNLATPMVLRKRESR